MATAVDATYIVVWVAAVEACAEAMCTVCALAVMAAVLMALTAAMGDTTAMWARHTVVRSTLAWALVAARTGALGVVGGGLYADNFVAAAVRIGTSVDHRHLILTKKIFKEGQSSPWVFLLYVAYWTQFFSRLWRETSVLGFSWLL